MYSCIYIYIHIHIYIYKYKCVYIYTHLCYVYFLFHPTGLSDILSIGDYTLIHIYIYICIHIHTFMLCILCSSPYRSVRDSFHRRFGWDGWEGRGVERRGGGRKKKGEDGGEGDHIRRDCKRTSLHAHGIDFYAALFRAKWRRLGFLCGFPLCILCCSVLQCVAHGIAFDAALFRAKRRRRRLGILSRVLLCILCCSVLHMVSTFMQRYSTPNGGDWAFYAGFPCAFCVPVCYSMLRCVTVRCRMMQNVAVCCSVLQCIPVYCNVFQCVAVISARVLIKKLSSWSDL